MGLHSKGEEMSKVLWVGMDGWDLRLVDYYNHPFWQKIKDDCSTAKIKCPTAIEKGEIATASSPRLWGRYYTGVPPDENGILGFWEKKTPDGDIVKANVSLDWIRKNRCEKLVDYNDLLVDPVWEIALKNQKSVGGCNLWFSYPLSDDIKGMIDQYGKWMLTDWPFPREHEKMIAERYRHPADAEPKEDYEDETGAGARVAIMKQEDPVGFYESLLKQDYDRYEYTLNMLTEKGTPDLCALLTRGIDGCQHQYRKAEDVPDELPDGEANLKKVYDLNMDGIELLWINGDFDYLVMCGDHGTTLEMEENGPRFYGKDHGWPAYAVIYGEDFPTFDGLWSKYENISATVLDLLDIEVPDWYASLSLKAQAVISERLRKLGYF